MSLIYQNRKRIRSADECDFTNQSKYFVNQQMINKHDKNKMNEIFCKTVNLLYKGAKDMRNNNEVNMFQKCDRFKTVRLFGNGEFTYVGIDKPNWIPAVTSTCLSCNKSSYLHGDCSNCNLNLCEYCGISCFDCHEVLCTDCVKIFDCRGTDEHPYCTRCKFYSNCGGV